MNTCRLVAMDHLYSRCHGMRVIKARLYSRATSGIGKVASVAVNDVPKKFLPSARQSTLSSLTVSITRSNLWSFL